MKNRRLSMDEMHALSMRVWNEEPTFPLADVKALYNYTRQLEADIRDRELKDTLKSFVGMTVHYGDDSDQPSVHVACLGWGSPTYNTKHFPPVPHKELHRFNPEGHLYTFEERLVTCQACKNTRKWPLFEIRVEAPKTDSWNFDQAFLKSVLDTDPEFDYAPGHRPRTEKGGRFYQLVYKGTDAEGAKERVLGVGGVRGVEVSLRSQI